MRKNMKPSACLAAVNTQGVNVNMATGQEGLESHCKQSSSLLCPGQVDNVQSFTLPKSQGSPALRPGNLLAHTPAEPLLTQHVVF